MEKSNKRKQIAKKRRKKKEREIRAQHVASHPIAVSFPSNHVIPSAQHTRQKTKRRQKDIKRSLSQLPHTNCRQNNEKKNEQKGVVDNIPT